MRHPARLAGASLLRLQSDSRLAELAVAGHAAAFETIVDRYRTPLLRYCAGIVGPSRAEDAVQQALINAHDALQRTDEVRHLRSWLYRIAHNASLNVLRAVRDDVPLEEASLPSTATGAPGPAESFETSERFRATVEALGELPERQRAALVLRELEGRSHEEIAEALGVTKGSARQHLMRARVAMRGAVTAITPYPIVARLAEALAAPGGAGWTDAAVGAGTGATLAKLTAGVAATGALVGGAVGTREVVHHHRGTPGASAQTRKATTVRAPVVRHATPIALPAAPAPAPAAAPTRGDGAGERHAAPHRGSGDRRRQRERDHPAASAPSQPATTAPGAGDAGSAPARDLPPGSGHHDGSGRSRHGSREDAPKRDSSGKDKHEDGSSGKGTSGGDSSGKGSSGKSTSGKDDDASGKGKHEGGDDTPTAALPTSTLPATPPPTDTSGSGSGSGGDGSGESGSGSSGSGSSGPSGSGDDGSTTVPAGG